MDEDYNTLCSINSVQEEGDGLEHKTLYNAINISKCILTEISLWLKMILTEISLWLKMILTEISLWQKIILTEISLSISKMILTEI